MKESIVKLHDPRGKKSILVIYTGGTFGMRFDNENRYLVPLEFEDFKSLVPEIKKFDFNIDFLSWSSLIDSSDVKPSHWNILINQIKDNFLKYDAFVILHGTDTLAYSASAISYGIQNLDKAIIFTGAQLPIGQTRNDARNNFLSSLEIAISGNVREVAVFFNNVLLRGNRSVKVKSADFDGFSSPNFHPLAKTGIDIEYYSEYLFRSKQETTFAYFDEKDSVASIILFPGIGVNVLRAVLSLNEIKGIVLETYGSGTCLSDSVFIEAISSFIENDGIVVAVSQCLNGKVSLGKYETSQILEEIGVISAFDMTREAALTKLMFLLSNEPSQEVKKKFQKSICGDVSKS